MICYKKNQRHGDGMFYGKFDKMFQSTAWAVRFQAFRLFPVFAWTTRLQITKSKTKRNYQKNKTKIKQEKNDSLPDLSRVSHKP